jgi:hypothetical protein
MAYFTDIDQVGTYLETLLKAHMNTFTPPVKNVEFARDSSTLGWPCITILAGVLRRTPLATGLQVDLAFNMAIYVMHAPLGMGLEARSYEDLKLAAQVRNLLHANTRLPDVGGNPQVVQSWIGDESPRTLATRKAPQVVSTQLLWYATSRGRIA